MDKKLVWMLASIGVLGGGALLWWFLRRRQEIQAPVVTPPLLAAKAPSSPAQCVKIGVQNSWMATPALKQAIEAAKASGLQIISVPTGSVAFKGTRSQFDAQVIWACPPGMQPPKEPRKEPLKMALPVPGLLSKFGEKLTR